MKINYNVSAELANTRLLNIEDRMSESMQRLSSGLKINHSKDNPAGMAISTKMQAQIDALDRASSNASDGVSVIQIADGALNEVTSILQRMREISVQAANGTMSDSEKEAIQTELDSLSEEIDRISEDTEYNSKKLLDGSMDTRVYGDGFTRAQVSNYVSPGNYEITVNALATSAEISTTGKDYTSSALVGASGKISINGRSVTVTADETYNEVYTSLISEAEKGNATVSIDASNALVIDTTEPGMDEELEITISDEALAESMGFTVIDTSTMATGTTETGFIWDDDEQAYVLKNVTKDYAGEITTSPVTGSDISVTAQITTGGFETQPAISTDGNKVTISDRGGFAMSFLVDDDLALDEPDPVTGAPIKNLEIEVTDIGAMSLQIGSNMDQNMDVRIQEVSTKSMYIDKVDVTKEGGPEDAMDRIGDAISYVSKVRSSMGASQNRLEYSVSSLDETEENMTSALSRLTDVDMADEMTNYSQQNILDQAAISVLSQANDMPQQVLQILQ